jgi:hypothetical protein
MKTWQAWREAAKLFWQRPVLSLPVLIAAISPFVLEGVDSLWKRVLLPPPIPAYGVRSTLSQTLLQPVKAYWPLMLGDSFVQVVICVIALCVTAGAVRRLNSDDATALLRHGMMVARSRWRDAMWLSLAGFVLFAFYQAARLVVLYFWVTYIRNRIMTSDSGWQVQILEGQVAVALLYTFLWCVGAWFLAGMAMRRMKTDGSQEITRTQVRSGKRLAIATVLLSAVLGFALTGLSRTVIPEGGLDGTVAGWELNALHSLIASFPYALLFIALTRIVDQDDNFMT